MYDDLTQEVQQFLYREARLLDERRLHEWLELFTDDARYWMGGRSNRRSKSSKAIAIFDPEPYLEDGPREANWPSSTRPRRRSLDASLASKREWSGWRTLRRARAI
jgi:3-phenylpropionate/cinnamic acid dioxygenase small subunit